MVALELKLRDAKTVEAIESFAAWAVAETPELQTISVAPMEPGGWLRLDRGIRAYCDAVRRRDGNEGNPWTVAIREAIEVEHRARGLNESKRPGPVFAKVQLAAIAYLTGPDWPAVLAKAERAAKRKLVAEKRERKAADPERSADGVRTIAIAEWTGLPHQELAEAEWTMYWLPKSIRGASPRQMTANGELLLADEGEWPWDVAALQDAWGDVYCDAARRATAERQQLAEAIERQGKPPLAASDAQRWSGPCLNPSEQASGPMRELSLGDPRMGATTEADRRFDYLRTNDELAAQRTRNALVRVRQSVNRLLVLSGVHRVAA